MPKVSALLPTYNTPENYLKEAIESVLNQSFTDFELIILDDASPNPDVEKVIKSYSDPRIRFEKNPQNLGISGTRNRLLDLAQGEYLAIIDHDDVSMPERFKKQVDFLDAHPETGVVGGWTEKIHNNKIVKYPEHNIDIENLFMYTVGVMHPVCMVRKSVLQQYNVRYEEYFSPAEDYALFARLINKTHFANIPEVLLRYRLHKNNTSRVKNKEMDFGSVSTRYFVRAENPAIAMRAELSIKKLTTIKLFRCITLMTIKQRGENRKKYYLFGVIPFISVKWRYKYFEE